MFQGSMVALVTPMTEGGALDLPALAALVEWHIGQKTQAIVVTGTTGESATLTHAERDAIYQCALKASASRVPIIAGTGANSTAETIELTAQAKAAGVQACLLVTPYYNKPSQEGLIQHHLAVADAQDIPQILYNVPSRTACDLLPETAGRLSEHPNIIGIKEATGDLDRLKALNRLAKSDFLLLSGDDATGVEFMLAGGHGIISVTANIAPAKMQVMCEAALAKDATSARKINDELQMLHRRLFIESNPIPVKWALEKMLKIPSGALRLPLTRLLEGHEDSVMEALKSIGVCQ
ncbi:MAG: 4-hydroxy-tetrahydrodipicolinate synthase [Legionellales bacterium]|nr:4-hydroxy-tetrahydrodipicolinate synthase [Legionellales bacterium]